MLAPLGGRPMGAGLEPLTCFTQADDTGLHVFGSDITIAVGTHCNPNNNSQAQTMVSPGTGKLFQLASARVQRRLQRNFLNFQHRVNDSF
jgi:hypothetical protein